MPRSLWTRINAYQAAMAVPTHAHWLPKRERERNEFLAAIERKAAEQGAKERERNRRTA